MKRAISLLLTAIMLCACLAITAYAEEEPVNYALTATYSVESSVGENIYGLKEAGTDRPRGNDSAHTRLNDGYTGYDECTGIENYYFKTGSGEPEDKITIKTEDTSVCYTGTNADITMVWDLGEVKNDIAKISFLNCRSDYEWAEENQFEDFMDGDYSNYSRSFPTDNINLWVAGEDQKFTRLKQKDGWTYEIVGLDNPYTDAVETELKDCKQRNVTMVFNQSLVGRYIKLSLSPKLYVMSLDEMQIFGGGEPGEIPTAAPTTSAAPTTQAATEAPAASTTEAAPASTTEAAAPTAAPTQAPATQAPATTAAAKTTDGGSNIGLIIGIIAAVIVVAAIIVVVIKKKK